MKIKTMKITGLLVTLVMLVTMLGVLALTASAADITSSQPAVGDGSESNPYQITSAGELYWFAEYVNAGNASACAKLMNDITVNENVIVNGALNSNTSEFVVWTPIGVRIGSSTKAFSGTFDGGNHTVSGLYVSATSGYQGLFGYIQSATVKNVKVADSYFSGTTNIGAVVGCYGVNGTASTVTNCHNVGSVVIGSDYYVGGVVGGQYAPATYVAEIVISNCSNSGSVTGAKHYVGGVIAYARSTSEGTAISGCINTGTVTNTSTSRAQGTGGIAGYFGGSSAVNVEIVDCINSGTIQIAEGGKQDYMGGIIGQNSYGHISDCNNAGTISGYQYAGGIVGSNSGTVTNCQNTGAVISTYAGIGGIVGRNTGTVTGCTNSANVQGQWNVGGIIGSGIGTGLSDCTNTGDVTSNTYGAGGVIGYVDTAGTVENCHNEGNVNGTYYIGGLVGHHYTGKVTYTKCSNKGSVEGSSYNIGGLFGRVAAGSTVTKCYNTGDVTCSGTYSVKDNYGVGGLAGTTYNAAIFEDCYNTGSVNGGSNPYVGGLVGFFHYGSGSTENYIKRSYNTGSVIGGSYVGGLFGTYESNGVSEECYNTGSVSGTSYVGGLVGYRDLTGSSEKIIKNCYNTGSVSGTTNVGGLFGYSYYNNCLETSYNVGSVRGTSSFGGVIGNNKTVVNCYYLDTCVTNGNTRTGATALTVEQMTDDEDWKTTFVGFDAEAVWTKNTNANNTSFLPGLKGSAYSPSLHVHGWAYSASDTNGDGLNDAIVAICAVDGCTEPNGGSVTVSAPSVLNYTGSSIDAECTYTDWKPAEMTIVYNAVDRVNVTGQEIVASVTAGEATVSVSYTITPRNIATSTVTISPSSLSYDGSEKTVTVTVKCGSTALVVGIDYEVTGTTSATEIGTYTVTVTGKGNCAGTVVKTWKISKGSLSSQIEIEGWTYLNAPNHPSVTSNPENGEVTYTYYISYSGRSPAKTGTEHGAETAGGIPTYAGTYYIGAVIAETEHYKQTTISPSAATVFVISPKEVNKPTFEGLQATYSYDSGNEIKPTFTLKDDKGNVIPESEYTVAYSNNTELGEATITIADVAEGNYTVSGSVTFNIVAHSHNYSYTLIGTDTIKATCSNEDGNCTATEQTIKLVAPSDLVYTGTAKTATVEGTIGGNIPEITYEGDCKSLGSHTASIMIGGVTASVSFTITECPHESYTDGDCDHCDYVCTHSTMTYNDNGDDTHTKNCPVCQYSASENHDHTNGKCVCGKKATPAYTVPSGITATYAQTLADVALPTGFTWQDEPGTPVGNVGTRTFKVTFTPDDTDNYEIVTDIEVTIAVEKATPNVSLTAPIDKVMGGYSIELNPTSDATEEITFEIIDGEGYSVNGNVITIDDGVVVGTTFTVKYRSVATDNYESAEGEITLTVGVPTVDTSALEEAIAALEGRLESLEAKFGTDGEVTKLREELDALKNIVSDLTNDRVTESELGTAISGVNNAVSALAERVKGLEDTYATKAEVNALKQDLNDQYGKLLDLINANTLDIGTINTTLGEIKTTLATLATKTDVATEINRLGQLIATLTTRVSNTETNISANAGEISSLKTTVEALATELRGADETLTNSVNDLSSALTTLTGRVDTAEQDIAKLKQDLADAINKLNNDIADGDKLNSDALIEAIGDLTALIDAAEKKASDADAEQKTDLLKSIEDAKSAITTAYEKAISDAVAKLEDADKNNSDALAEAIKNLEALIDAAEEAAIEGDNTLSGKIVEAIAKAEDELKTAKESLEALIGGVQSNLDKAKTELDKAIADLDAAMKKGDADLSAEITNLNTALKNAKTALEKADADNKAELVSKIETADSTLDAAIKQVQKNLDDAKSELDTAIKNGDTALDEKITDLNTALDNAVAALEATDAANKSELEGKITSAQSTLQAAIDEVASDLAAAEKALADAISKGDAALSDSISSVSASLSAAKSALEKADANNKAALEAKIADAEATLDAAIKAVQKNLDDAKTALEKALADGDKANADALAQAISDLNAAIDAAETAAVTADGSLKSELTSKIDNADAALEAAIEALAGELDTVKNALEARDNELQTFIIIVCVISGVALCGSGAFVVWFFIDRKKRI